MIEQIKISTPFIKLDSLLKFAGAAMTGGEAKEYILQGMVLIDGEVCLLRGKKIKPGMRVQIADKVLEVVTD